MNNIEALHMIDLRIRGLVTNDPNNLELIRLKMARGDVEGRTSPAEKAAIEAIRNPSPQVVIDAKRAAQDAANKIISENRDRPSI